MTHHSLTGPTPYVLGHSADEQRRLDLQGAQLRPFTERLLHDAGIRPGLRVLDVGCGTGDVAEWNSAKRTSPPSRPTTSRSTRSSAATSLCTSRTRRRGDSWLTAAAIRLRLGPLKHEGRGSRCGRPLQHDPPLRRARGRQQQR
jgi:hypothetical protein